MGWNSRTFIETSESEILGNRDQHDMGNGVYLEILDENTVSANEKVTT